MKLMITTSKTVVQASKEEKRKARAEKSEKKDKTDDNNNTQLPEVKNDCCKPWADEVEKASKYRKNNKVLMV